MNNIFKKKYLKSMYYKIIVSKDIKINSKTSSNICIIIPPVRHTDYKILTLKVIFLILTTFSSNTVWAAVICVTDPVSGGNTATGAIAVACGINNTASGLNSSASGIDNTASNEATSALG